jgi:hypothetical protein
LTDREIQDVVTFTYNLFHRIGVMPISQQIRITEAIAAVPEGEALQFKVVLSRGTGRTLQVAFAPQSEDRFSQAAIADFLPLWAYTDINDRIRPLTVTRQSNSFLVAVPDGVNEIILKLGTVVDKEREAPEHFQLRIGNQRVDGVIGADPIPHPKFWWRHYDWFRSLLFDHQSEWRKKWLDSQSPQNAFYREKGHKKSYREEVVASFGEVGKNQYNEFGDVRNFAKLARLLEVYLEGGVFDARGNPILPSRGKYTFNEQGIRNSDGTLNYARPPNPSAPNRHEILITGDSITDEGSRIGVWTRALRNQLQASHREWSIWNLAVSGSSTSSAPEGLSQKANLSNALQVNPTPGIVIVTMTVNGLLRGDPLSQMKTDVSWMVGRALQTGAQVVLIGGYRPFTTPNWRPQMTPQDRAFLSARKLADTAQGYAFGLSRVYDEVASRYTANARFTYIQNFWAPLDGVNAPAIPKKFTGGIQRLQNLAMHQAQLSEFLMDRVHPKADLKIASKLAGQIRAAIEPLLTNSGKSSTKAADVEGVALDANGPGIVPIDYTPSLSGGAADWATSLDGFAGSSADRFYAAFTPLAGIDDEDPFRRGRWGRPPIAPE